MVGLKVWAEVSGAKRLKMLGRIFHASLVTNIKYSAELVERDGFKTEANKLERQFQHCQCY